MRRVRIGTISLIGAALLTSCAALFQPPAPMEKRVPADFPAPFYDSARARGAAVFRVDPDKSEAVIYSYRGGSLSRLGHDHAIASRDVNGYILLQGNSPIAGQADLYIQLDALVVDEPARRAQAGFVSQPSESDIAGTRKNMLEKVLQAEQYPFALIHVSAVEGEPTAPVLNATMSLHGVSREIRVPAEFEYGGPELRVRGSFSLRQTEFAITPYSMLGGMLQVLDPLELHFQITAVRLPMSVAPATAR